ncbi:MAG: chain-length determining protein [Hydrogenophaga sp.]
MTEAPTPVAGPPATPAHSRWQRLTARIPRLHQHLHRHPLLSVALVISALSGLYWGLIASDRYVAEARVVIQRTDLNAGANMDFSSLLALGSGGNRTDQLLMRDHLLSLDMLRKLETRLQLREHFATQGDWLSRLWDRQAPMEEFLPYFRSRVNVELDEYAGVLAIQTQAYTPEMAQAIAQIMVAEGERTMNTMGHALAQEQVNFLEQQVQAMGQRAQKARSALLGYQNRKGLVSPQATAENVTAIVNRLEAQLADLQTRRNSMLGYLQPDHANVLELGLQINAVQQQIRAEKSRLTAPGGQTLNATVEEYGRLELEARFAQEVYQSSLVALEKGRVEATRTLKKISILQSAGLPEYPLQPRRLYHFTVFTLVAFVLAGLMQLLKAIVQDHRD